jgi:hypothetical protein
MVFPDPHPAKRLQDFTDDERRIAANVLYVFTYWMTRQNILCDNEAASAAVMFAIANELPPPSTTEPESVGWTLPEYERFEEGVAALDELDAERASLAVSDVLEMLKGLNSNEHTG